ncbi:hypothetical protein F2P81_019719 [Scophthalmus maximus]|uniref:Uncharacterized protein n=1 Tax=Scophthalmus maximus TaxID=52904 RepID=A0A6A4SDI6_SCOMX|nr:hypothetical protein F2P81_019719 [Scophthalmus maximus]
MIWKDDGREQEARERPFLTNRQELQFPGIGTMNLRSVPLHVEAVNLSQLLRRNEASWVMKSCSTTEDKDVGAMKIITETGQKDRREVRTHPEPSGCV